MPDSDLTKYKLNKAECGALKVIKDILLVSLYHLCGCWSAVNSQNSLKIPHAFQHVLSHEKTPTLAYTIPAFQSMIKKWMDLKTKFPDAADIIDEGINKLEIYENKLEAVPANIIATGIFFGTYSSYI
jgi:hypothetical protein